MMRRVVGEDAAEFICQCSILFKEYCPLNTESYSRMDDTAKERMLKKIKEKFDLPATVDGENVDKALHTQCRNLYKFWRYRIKEEHFSGRTKEEALAELPLDVTPEVWAWLVNFWSSPKQKDKSEKARKSRLARKFKSANGSLSTARIFHDMEQRHI